VSLHRVIFFTILLIAAPLFAETTPDIDTAGGFEHVKDPPPNEKPIQKTFEEESDERVYAVETTYRSEYIYPSNYGTAGIFRLRSAESLPDGALTFGIGGEFYSVSDIPPEIQLAYGPGNANTIAESLFIGYSPTKQLSLGVVRRNSSTTFGTPQTLISSLGDFNFSAMYSFPLSPSFAIAPIFNFLIASNFNNLAPAGSTISAGGGLAGTFSFYPSLNVPLFLHANLLYHMPQLRTTKVGPIDPEAFFNFSRFHTVTFALGGEYKIGDFIPFLEFQQIAHTNSAVSWGRSPAKITVGSRITPLSNKGLSVLLGTDIGLSRNIVAGVPFTPGYTIIGQLSYTFGLNTTERKHYYTTTDVNVVDRKFVIRKNIKFKVAKAELDPSSANLLNQIADVIKENGVKRLLISGHTDSTANEEYNLRLSLARANAVKAYLVGRGIPEDSLSTQGFGKRKPRASNLTETGRQENRRVEFFILE
jgi:outer membrane protein OmpA-like peptidoglycan-associated protein